MDKNYWNNYYKNYIAPVDPSQFARWVGNYLQKGQNLLELGSGNGRDSIYFSMLGLNVTAIDQAESAKFYFEKCPYEINFINYDFVFFDKVVKEKYDNIYSRFSLHSITHNEEDILLSKIKQNLNSGGKLFLEARCDKDDIFGLGQEVERNAFVFNNHYRRFIILEELAVKLNNIGFNISYAEESRNFAMYKEENPIVLRLVANTY